MIEVKIHGDELVQAVRHAAEHQIAEELGENFRSWLREKAEEAIEERIAALTGEEIAAAVREVLATGWAKTNSYGERTGQVTTVSSRVREWLEPRDSYRNPLPDIFREELTKALKGELGKVLAEATAKLRAMVDETIAAKLRGVLKDAIKGGGDL